MKFDCVSLAPSVRYMLYALFGTLIASAPATSLANLFQLPLEQLVTMKITSAAKKEQQISDTAAAVFVISAEDIERSGLRSVPELLRLVPGIQVARIDASKWAVSSRGFNAYRSNKLLVLRDGRSLYNPLFSGTYWDVQEFPLHEIERIEVIRGSGGSLWGANAVNGIINIISKKAADTSGQRLNAQIGDQDKTASYHFGASVSNALHYRVYIRKRDSSNYKDRNDLPSIDDWNLQQGGFRIDWQRNEQDSLTLQGDLYQSEAGLVTGYLQDVNSTAEFRNDEAELDGGNLLLNWKREFSPHSSFVLRTYFDRARRRNITIGEYVDSFDVDFQYRFAPGQNHDLTLGGGYRHVSDKFINTFTVSVDPATLDQDVFSLFVQDDIALSPAFRLTLGAKLEENDFTGTEFQPNLRILWKMADNKRMWAALSESVRTPSRAENHMRVNLFTIPPNPGNASTTLVSIFGNEDLQSESQRSVEIGFRNQINDSLSFDVALYHNRYEDLITTLNGFRFEPPISVISRTFVNQMSGTTRGLELASSWQARSDLRLHLGWSLIDTKLQSDTPNTDAGELFDRNNGNPEQQLQLRGQWNIDKSRTLDLLLVHNDSITLSDLQGSSRIHIPAYTRLDTRFSWQLNQNLDLALTGQNLLEDQHPEFFTREVLANQVPRSVYAEISLRF
jgi:iron complex outermembrane receptor protein